MISQDLAELSNRLTFNAVKMYGLIPLQMATREVYEELDEDIRAASTEAGAACKAGCDYCCHRPIPISSIEASLIVNHVLSWEPEALEGLKARLKQYDEATRPQRINPPGMMRHPCPFLENRQCLIYLMRPLCCRGQASTDAEACRKWDENPTWGSFIPQIKEVNDLALAVGSGQMEGAKAGGATPAMLELGLAIQFLLENEDLITRVSRDASPAESVVWGTGMRPKPGEPSGLRTVDPSVARYGEQVLFWAPGAKELLPDQGMNAHEALLMLQTPVAYESEDQLLESREWYGRAVDAFAGLELDSAEVFDAIGRFPVQTLPAQGMNDRDLNRKIGEALAGHTARVFPDLTAPIEPRKREGKFRVGFVGASLCGHQGGRWALGYLMKPREDVETYAIQLASDYDRYTELFRTRCDHFYQLLGSVPECGRFIRSLELDAIVFLGPHSNSRCKQFVGFQLAPLQVTTWGTPFSPGFPRLSHYLASDCMEPENANEHYSETLVRLPGFHLCYERSHIAEPVDIDTTPIGRGPNALISQLPNKLLPRRDELFKRVADVLGTPLLAIDHNDRATNIVRRRMSAAGVPVKWINPMHGPQFLGLVKSVQLTLDTPDWNGGNTTLESWTCGTPVISMPGIMMRGRHTLGFLKVMGQEDLVAKSDDEYVSMVKNHAEMKERTLKLPIDQLFENHSATDRFYACLRNLAGWE